MTEPLQGLEPQMRARFKQAADALAAGKPRDAEALVRELCEHHPGQPDVLHLLAATRARLGDHAGALVAIRRALAQRPEDASFHCLLGNQLAATGQLDAALDALQSACALQPNLAMAWYNLGVLQVRATRFDEAEASLRRAIQLVPDDLRARLQLADVLKMAGRSDDAAAIFREALAARPACGDAWWGLANISSALDDDDIPAMQAALGDPRASERDRVVLGCAMARVLDHANRCEEAMGVLKETHAHARVLQPWDARAFTRGLDAILSAFVAPPPPVSERGRGVIFITSLPRSGSTLTEQILASHSQVEGSGELHDLLQVLLEESQRRGTHYPAWVDAMMPDDWARLGNRYLERTARWREHTPFFTDKLPGNWLHIGAIRAMLPGAKVVVCRRDPIETCFACYRQYMNADGQGWTHRFEDLGAFWNDFDRAVRHWRERLPGFIYEHNYEDLLADPECSIRALLAFCGLSYESGCLEFHRNAREVRSPSAAQVREPLRGDTARAPRYGSLLEPLRNALGVVDIMSHH